MSLSAEILGSGGVLLAAALLLFAGVLSGRVATKRQLDDKDRQIQYLQDALDKRDEQFAALLVSARVSAKSWQVIESLAQEQQQKGRR